MTISVGEMFVNFILFNGKILKFQEKNREMPLKYGDLAIFDIIERESGRSSQNRETSSLWGRVDRCASTCFKDGLLECCIAICAFYRIRIDLVRS